MNMAENRIRPARVMTPPADALPFVLLIALTVCELCDAVEIVLLAISGLLRDLRTEQLLHSEIDVAISNRLL